jgi:hypothetical protein
VKYCPAPDFFLVRVLLEQALVEVAQALGLRAVPIELVELGDQRRQRRRLLDERAGVAEDLLHQRRAVRAEVNQRQLVVLEAVGRGLLLEIVPAVALGDLLLGARLLRHLEEEQVGELGDVLVVRDPVVLEDVAEVPELLDDVVGDGAHESLSVGQAAGGQRDSLKVSSTC